MFDPDRLDAMEQYEFWREACMTMTRNVCDVLKLAGEPVTPTNVAAIVRSLPLEVEWLDGPGWTWKRGYFYRCMQTIHVRTPDHLRFQELKDYFFDYFLDREARAQYMIIHSFSGILLELPVPQPEATVPETDSPPPGKPFLGWLRIEKASL